MFVVSYLIRNVALLLTYCGEIGNVTRTKEQCRERRATIDIRDTDHACWFLTPTRLAQEMIFLVPFLLIVGMYCLSRFYKVNKANKVNKRPKDSAYPVWLKISLCLHLLLTCYYKACQGILGLVWLLMPCMINTLSIVFSVLVEDEDQNDLKDNTKNVSSFSLRQALDQISISLFGLACITFVAPDTSGLNQPFEVPFFYIQHLLLVLWPIYLIHSNKANKKHLQINKNFSVYLLLNSIWSQIGWGCVLSALYFGPVTIISYLVNLNVNYMTHPLLDFIQYDSNYRIVSFFGMMVLMIVSRCFLIGIGMVLDKKTKGE